MNKMNIGKRKRNKKKKKKNQTLTFKSREPSSLKKKNCPALKKRRVKERIN
jgi:hypothetical protein